MVRLATLITLKINLIKYMSQNKSYNPPEYCFGCGRKLIQRSFLYAYDTNTGDKLMGTTFYCPVSKLRHIFGSHEKISYDPEGWEIIERHD